ncbi:hypothetical protein Y032_0245g3563 [Ancylostoma ceylanicum]|uniref:Transthyretin-like family protein n=1 Tax=Ancylostoma ceylanicum TaxID=53326 RepID=A0A016SD69_9BILA|nr:hypothetical protein Y032_0245g3563 [Ancylostoma ceylanicum]
MFLSVLFVLVFATATSAHTVTVRGMFLCQMNLRLPVFVELMESDAFGDDRLQWKNTVVWQFFEIKGSEDERYSITPYLRVSHKCRGFEETLIIHFGHRKGDVIINLGDVDLEDPETNAVLRHKYVF